MPTLHHPNAEKESEIAENLSSDLEQEPTRPRPGTWGCLASWAQEITVYSRKVLPVSTLDVERRVAPGVIELNERPEWGSLDSICEIFCQYFPGVADGNFPPPSDYEQFRAQIVAARPDLAAYARRLSELVGSASAVSCVCVPDLGLIHHRLSIQRLAVYTMAVLMGEVTPTDNVRRNVVWDVAKKDVGKVAHPTFSEHDREARYHTDSQYRLHPETHFCLYVSRAAGCGGGASMLLDGETVREVLDQTPQGREAVAVLTHPVPFRVPSLFTSQGYQGEAEYIHAPVFSDQIPWRWRYDTLKSGIEETAVVSAEVVDKQAVLWAAEYLDQSIRHAPG